MFIPRLIDIITSTIKSQSWVSAIWVEELMFARVDAIFCFPSACIFDKIQESSKLILSYLSDCSLLNVFAGEFVE